MCMCKCIVCSICVVCMVYGMWCVCVACMCVWWEWVLCCVHGICNVCVCVCLCICCVFSSACLHRDISFVHQVFGFELSPIRVLLALLREPYFVPGHKALNLATHTQGLPSDSDVCILAPARTAYWPCVCSTGILPSPWVRVCSVNMLCNPLLQSCSAGRWEMAQRGPEDLHFCACKRSLRSVTSQSSLSWAQTGTALTGVCQMTNFRNYTQRE